jgi:YidC/Oxa1 family membrane protein insertase
MEQRPFMDRNQLIGFALIGAILLGTSFWASTVEPSQPKKTAGSEEVKSSSAPAAEAELDYALPASDSSSPDQEFTLENDQVRYVISNKGAQIKSVELKEYKDWQGKPLMLVDGNQVLDGPSSAIAFAASYEGRSLSLSDNLGSVWTYELPAEGYGLRWSMSTPSKKDVVLTWRQAGIRHEKSQMNEATNTSIYYLENADKERGSLSDGSDDEESQENLGWVAHRQQYFSSILQTESGFVKADMQTRTPGDTLHSRLFESKLRMASVDGKVSAKGI